ncbi:hypothetical protein V1226_00195 [Lachnospiraceae bacterium JLR.KK009]
MHGHAPVRIEGRHGALGARAGGSARCQPAQASGQAGGWRRGSRAASKQWLRCTLKNPYREDTRHQKPKE